MRKASEVFKDIFLQNNVLFIYFTKIGRQNIYFIILKKSEMRFF